MTVIDGAAEVEAQRLPEMPPHSQESIAARIERIPIVGWHIRTRLIVGVATFFNGFDMLAVAYALPVLAPLWRLTPTQSGLLLSSLFFGELIGAPLFGAMAERFGRRRILIVCTAIFSIMSFASGFSWSYRSLLIARFLTGLGLGAQVPIAISYITEISRAEGRGRFILLYELIFPVGLVVAGLVGLSVVTSIGWRPLFIIGGAPALIILFMQHQLPESPRWLAHRGRVSEAHIVVSMIESTAVASLGTSLPEPVSGIAVQAHSASWRDLMGPAYLSRSLVIWSMFFCCFAINFGLTTWLPSLFASIYSLPLGEALRDTLIIQAIGFLGTLGAALSIDRIGRKPLFIGAFLGAAVILLVLWAVGIPSARVLLYGGCVSYFFISMISISLWLYAPELYPTRVRSVGVSIGYMTATCAGVITPILVGMIVGKFGLGAVFLIFGILAALTGLVMMALGIETKGRALEQISP